jgi:hypothetical protein
MDKRPHSDAVLLHHRSHEPSDGGAAGAGIREITCEHREAGAELGRLVRVRTAGRLVPRGRGERRIEELWHRVAELLQRSFDAPERGYERRRGAPRTRGGAETLCGGEQRASLVVQLVRRITRVVSHCRQAGTPERRRQWGRSCSLRVDVRVTPDGMRGTTHADHAPSRRTLGRWGYPAHTRARGGRVGERTHATTAHGSSVRSTALER